MVEDRELLDLLDLGVLRVGAVELALDERAHLRVVGQRGASTCPAMPCSAAQGTISSSSSVISTTGNGRRSPCITAWETQRDCLRSFSKLAGVRFLPPAVMMMSFLRPVMER